MKPTLLRIVILSVLLSGCATHLESVRAPDAPPKRAENQSLLDAIVAREKELLMTLQKNDIKAFADLLPEDILAIDDEGFHDKAEFVKAMEDQKRKGLRFTDFQMSNIRVIPLGADAATLVYGETARGIDEAGKHFDWRINTQSIYERRGGQWVFRLFQDTVAK